MSSPKAARTQRRPKAAASKPVAKSVRAASKPAAKLAAVSSVTDNANQLAATLERALADGKADAIAPEALQTLLAALCKTYSVQLETDPGLLPVVARSVNSTDVMVTASGLLKSSNLAVFELGMWQSWSGR
jgi:hypothetical protein